MATIIFADMLIRFDQFVFDDETGELQNTDGRTRLEPEASKTLRVLIANAGELVTSKELSFAVWPDAQEERGDSVSFCIRQLRVALGDNASAPRFIETLSGMGYSFIAPITGDDGLEAEMDDTDTAAAESSRRSKYVVTGILAVLYIGFRLYAHFNTP